MHRSQARPVSQPAAPAQRTTPVPLDAKDLQRVAGGLPRGGWLTTETAESTQLPRGGW